MTGLVPVTQDFTRPHGFFLVSCPIDLAQRAPKQWDQQVTENKGLVIPVGVNADWYARRVGVAATHQINKNRGRDAHR